MQHFWLLFVASLLCSVCGDLSQNKHHRKKHADNKHHHGHHHHHEKHGHHKHHHHDHKAPAHGAALAKAPVHKIAAVAASKVMTKSKVELGTGQLEVNGPLPKDFGKQFADGVAKATGCDPTAVQVLKSSAGSEGLESIEFRAPRDVVSMVQTQAGDENSKLAQGPLRLFLIAKDTDTASEATSSNTKICEPGQEPSKDDCTQDMPETPVAEKGIDIDTAMPYGDLEPFGREDTAQELTESSVKESDEMVDQLERAEVAEEKRAVFRALTRLRGAAITSFDGVARSQTGNIDEYNKVHKWRSTHPLHHLADEESDITKWAFPDNADF